MTWGKRVHCKIDLPFVVVCVDRWGKKRHLSQLVGVTICGRRYRNTWRAMFPYDDVQEFQPKDDCQQCRRIQEELA